MTDRQVLTFPPISGIINMSAMERKLFKEKKMLDTAMERLLPTGEKLRILRLITPEKTPDRIVRYLIASLGYDSYRRYVPELSYWRLYYREALAGNFANEVTDHLYLAEVNGELAARMWFAYSRRTLRGNFGNVFTEPEFRQRGLMSELLKICMADFTASPARMLCCASGNEAAVRAYAGSGFQLIYGGKSGPLAMVKDGDFAGEAARVYGRDAVPSIIREGTIGDQFDCDKFLFYCDSVYHGRGHIRRGVAALLPDFRTVYQECLSGNGKVFVAENSQGAITGYAFAVNFYGNGVLDFTCHGEYPGDVPELLNAAAGAVDFVPYLTLGPEDREKAGLARSAGMTDAVSGKEFPCFFRFANKNNGEKIP